MFNGGFFLLIAASISLELVDAKFDAINVETLLKHLSTQTTSKLKADAMCAKEPVVIHVETQPIDTVLSQLAEVIGAQVEERNGVKVITRPSWLDSRQRTEESVARKKKWSEILQGALAEVNKSPKLNDAIIQELIDPHGFINKDGAEGLQRNHNSLIWKQPVVKTAVNLLSQIGASAVSEIPVGQRKVFSNRPTAAQLAFPKNTISLIDELSADLIKLDSASTSAQKKERTLVGGLTTYADGDPSQGDRIVLSVRKRTQTSITAALTLLDKEGRIVAMASVGIPPRSSASPFIKPGGGTFELSTEQHDLIRIQTEMGVQSAYSRVYSGANESGPIISGTYFSFAEFEGKTPGFGLASRIRDFVTNDPLGYIAGPLLRKLAGSENRNLIATLSDASVYMLSDSIRRNGITTFGEIEAYLKRLHEPDEFRNDPAVFTRQDGWLLVSPHYKYMARSSRFPRDAAKKFVDQMNLIGGVTLASALDYVRARRQVPDFRFVEMMLFKNAAPNVESEAPTRVFTPVCDFLVTLPAGQGPFAVPFGQLSLTQRAVVSRWVFDGAREGNSNSVHLPRFATIEPTEEIVSGIPPETVVRYQRKVSPAVIGKSTLGYSFGFSPEGFVDVVEGQARPMGVQGAQPREYKGFIAATLTTYWIDVEIPGRSRIRQSAFEFIPNNGALEVPAEDINNDFMELVAKVKSNRNDLRPPR